VTGLDSPELECAAIPLQFSGVTCGKRGRRVCRGVFLKGENFYNIVDMIK
jgi:hypothetical protein